jgi:hypothetical protein
MRAFPHPRRPPPRRIRHAYPRRRHPRGLCVVRVPLHGLGDGVSGLETTPSREPPACPMATTTSGTTSSTWGKQRRLGGTGRRGLAPCRRGQRRCGACPSAAQGGAARNAGLVLTSPCRGVVARGSGSMNPRSSPNPMRRLDDDNGLLMLMMMLALLLCGAYIPGCPRLLWGPVSAS